MCIRKRNSNPKKENQQEKQGDDAMSNSVTSYAGLDLHSLGKKKIRFVSSEEALKDVTPIEWEEDVLQGRKKAIVTKRKNKE